ncbi:unnamed protein product, partial [marine sediment metagenome]
CWIGVFSDKLFEEGKSTVLFLDEFDSIARERADPTEIGEMKRAVNELLRSIDLLMYENHPLVIIASTNHELTLDSAAWRRFLYHIHFPLPDLNERKLTLEYYFKNLRKSESNIILDLNFQFLAEQLEGYSPSDIERLVRSLYLEFLASKKIKEFLISNNKILSLVEHIGGTRDHLVVNVFNKKSEGNKKDQQQKPYSISELLKKEIEKTKQNKKLDE